MGKKDTLTKEYMSDYKRFADVLNYLFYNGEQVVKPETLHEIDSTQINVPYGAEGAKFITQPVQKVRDVYRSLTMMKDNRAVYLMVGIENQTKQSFTMPVRNLLYDVLEYAGQIQEAAKSHREAVGKGEEKPTDDEYLSGFYKSDRLIPVVTLVINWNAGEWEGPVSLHEMMLTQDEELMKYVADYKINLLNPSDMTEKDFEKFKTQLGDVLRLIKYSKDKKMTKKLLQEKPQYKQMDVETAILVKEMTGMKLKLKAEKEEISMWSAWAEMAEDSRREGLQTEKQDTALRMIRSGKFSDDDITAITELPAEEILKLRKQKKA